MLLFGRLCGRTPFTSSDDGFDDGPVVEWFMVRTLCAKKFKCSGWGVFGCFVGSVIGLFFLPLGIVLGPFLGTVAGELIAGRELSASVRGGFGALLGFVLCLGLKLAAVGLFAWWYFACLPHSP